MMKRLYILLISVLSIGSLCPIHGNNWLHVYRCDSLFNSYPTDSVSGVAYLGGDGGYKNMVVTLTSDTSIVIPMTSIEKCEVGNNVPMITITTTDYVEEIPDKENYMSATFTMRGYDIYDDVSCAVSIRGRGNSTWSYPKKPYRLKFPTKISIGGLPAAKSYVLLADYLDHSHMRNAVALKIAQLLGMPYTNDAVPVNVTLNGEYRGAYVLTQKIGMTTASVDLDEMTSVLFEMDVNYDEDFKFISDIYNLPVQIKDPEMTDSTFAYWQADFNAMVNAVASDTADWAEYIDINSLVDYMIVYNLVGNHEINWPKSTYLYKSVGGKYRLGPVWDFDWAFGHDQSTDQSLLMNWEGHLLFSPFLKEIVTDERFLELYRQRWEMFKTDKSDELWSYIDEYAEMIEPAIASDMTVWHTTESFNHYVGGLKKYLNARISFIDSNPQSMGLF